MLMAQKQIVSFHLQNQLTVVIFWHAIVEQCHCRWQRNNFVQKVVLLFYDFQFKNQIYMSVDYGETVVAVETRLRNIQSDLKRVISNRSMILSSKSCKRINLQFSLAIKHAKLHRINFAHILNRCAQMIMFLILSYEPEKYGHRFPFLSHLSRKLQQWANKKIELPKPEQLIQSIRASEKPESLYYLNPISLVEMDFVASPRVDQYFRDLTDSSILLQNSQCVCCSQFFQNNHVIRNENPMFKTLIELSQKQGFDRLLLMRNLNAVSNAGGGVILIGTQMKKNVKVIMGIRFKTMEDIYIRQKELENAILSLKPNCSYSIQRVMVQASSINPQNIGQEFMRICFRIKIFPIKASLSYLEFFHKGYSSVYEIYKFDAELKPNKILFHMQEDKEQSVYTFAHERFRSRTTVANIHANINCFNPCQNYSKYFCKYIAEGNAPAEVSSPEMSSEDEIIHKDDPKFKYEHTSLIIVGSKKQDRHVENFASALNGIKENFEMCRPFAQSFKDGARSIWMISHRLSYVDLKTLLKRFETRELVKPNCLTLMPVHRYLQIEKVKLQQCYQIELETMFKSRYKDVCKSEIIVVTDAKLQSKEVVRFSFNSYSEGIFAYLVLQSQQLKPYFIRKGHI